MGIFRARASVVHEKFGDETVIVNLESGCYYSIQGAGDAIWSAVMEGVPRDDILRRIQAAYAGDRQQIIRETAAFLDQLAAEALVEAAAPAAAMAESVTAAPGAPPFETPRLDKYTDMEEMLQLDPIHEVDEMGWPQAKPA